MKKSDLKNLIREVYEEFSADAQLEESNQAMAGIDGIKAVLKSNPELTKRLAKMVVGSLNEGAMGKKLTLTMLAMILTSAGLNAADVKNAEKDNMTKISQQTSQIQNVTKSVEQTYEKLGQLQEEAQKKIDQAKAQGNVGAALDVAMAHNAMLAKQFGKNSSTYSIFMVYGN